MFVSHRDLNVRYLANDVCHQGEERKQPRLAEKEARAGSVTTTTAYGITLSTVSSFNYLGRVLLESDNN